MKDGFGKEILSGMYILPSKEGFNLSTLEIYNVIEKDENFIAQDIDGKCLLIKDPGYYGRKRNGVHFGELDCVSLIRMTREIYEDLKDHLIRKSRLLQMLEDNKANLSANMPEPVIVNKSHASKEYRLRETNFTPGSRLNH